MNDGNKNNIDEFMSVAQAEVDYLKNNLNVSFGLNPMNKDKEDKLFKWDSLEEKEKYDLLMKKNQIKQASMDNTNTRENVYTKKLIKLNDNMQGFTNALLLTLVTGFFGGMIATIMYFVLSK